MVKSFTKLINLVQRILSRNDSCSSDINDQDDSQNKVLNKPFRLKTDREQRKARYESNLSSALRNFEKKLWKFANSSESTNNVTKIVDNSIKDNEKSLKGSQKNKIFESFTTNQQNQLETFNDYEQVIRVNDLPLPKTALRQRKCSIKKARQEFLKSLQKRIVELTNNSNIHITSHSKLINSHRSRPPPAWQPNRCPLHIQGNIWWDSAYPNSKS